MASIARSAPLLRATTITRIRSHGVVTHMLIQTKASSQSTTSKKAPLQLKAFTQVTALALIGIGTLIYAHARPALPKVVTYSLHSSRPTCNYVVACQTLRQPALPS